MDALARADREASMETARKQLGCKVDVGEIYSPPIIVSVAEAMGLRKGFSLDLTCPRMDGKQWDFSVPRYRREAMELIKATKPFLVIGSPPCTA